MKKKYIYPFLAAIVLMSSCYASRPAKPKLKAPPAHPEKIGDVKLPPHP